MSHWPSESFHRDAIDKGLPSISTQATIDAAAAAATSESSVRRDLQVDATHWDSHTSTHSHGPSQSLTELPMLQYENSNYSLFVVVNFTNNLNLIGVISLRLLSPMTHW